MTKSLILIEFNEVSFYFLNKYIEKGSLKNFAKFIDQNKVIITNSEKEFCNLEPWIQWVTVHTGLEFEEHKVFRLGDAKNQPENIWNKLNNNNLNSFLLSPMNAVNPNNDKSIFIPDPWTPTHSTNNFFFNSFHKTISSMVNDNSKGDFKIFDLISFTISFIRFARFKNYITYFKLALYSYKKKWNRAIFLDLLISDIFIGSFNNKKYSYGSVFFNAAAHIQHHYFFSSDVYKGINNNPSWYCLKKHDPLLDVYTVYDSILEDILKNNNSSRIIIATGLSQDPVDNPTYYWRLKDHEKFLNDGGITFLNVEPRMSRDFLINFSNSCNCDEAEYILENIFCFITIT